MGIALGPSWPQHEAKTLHGPDVVCNCHDCTQVRGRRLAEQVKRDYETFTSILGSFENRLMEHISYKAGVLASIFDQLAHIEQSQATLAGALCPPRRGKVHGYRIKKSKGGQR